MSATKLRFLHKGSPPPPPPPPPPPSSAFTYDTAIGNGVDSSGFADLPLRPTTAKRIYVNSSTGSSGNTGLSAASPKATGAQGIALVTDGAGDQLLIAEGTTYAELLPSVAFLNGGFSLLYPLVIQSYDPTDPTNEAKIGRANGSGSHARPKFTGDNSPGHWLFGGGAARYIAVRGIDIDPGDTASQGITGILVGSGILFENNLLRNADIELSTNTGPTASNWIFRNNAIYGGWNTDPTNSTQTLQGIYGSGCDSMTIEDNVFWHCGWRISTATRGDGTASGNASVYSHAIYQQANEAGCCISRRNFMADISADAGSHRSDAVVTNNLIFTTPIAIGLGGGVGYDVKRPFGNALDCSYNAIIGTAQINTATPATAAGWGLSSYNGKNGYSLAHHNIIAHGLLGVGPSSFTYLVGNDFSTTTSYLTADHNVSYQWMDSGNTERLQENGFTGTCHFTGTNNYWDDPASGSNLNYTSGTFPNAYDYDALCAAAGYTDKATAIAYAIANPEARIQRTILSYAWTGYGITPALQDLAMDAAFVTGTTNAGVIVGTIDGSVLTYSGFPSHVTINSDTRTWRDDGTATVAATGPWSITETHPTIGARTTNGTWTTFLAPLLTSPTSSAITATTATIGITTNTGSGNLYYIVTASALSPAPHQAGVELHHDEAATNYFKFGSQAISSTGAKTANPTGLTTGHTYSVYWVQTITTSGRKVYSLVGSGSFTTS